MDLFGSKKTTKKKSKGPKKPKLKAIPKPPKSDNKRVIAKYADRVKRIQSENNKKVTEYNKKKAEYDRLQEAKQRLKDADKFTVKSKYIDK